MTLLAVTGKPGKPIDPELYTLGRKMWKELKRGLPYVESNLSEMETLGNLPLTEWHYQNCKYVPEMFDA